MSLRKSTRLSATPSLNVTTNGAPSNASGPSFGQSTSRSPTGSTFGSQSVNDPSTSISDPDDYGEAAREAPQTMSSTKITTKSLTRLDDDSSPPHNNRRASGRLRKPTEKAQALSGVKPVSSPPSDTIVISSSRAAEEHSQSQRHSTPPQPRKEVAQEPPQVAEIPETPTITKALAGSPSSDSLEEIPNADATNNDSPSRRVSQRERKPTAKILETSSTPAPPAIATTIATTSATSSPAPQKRLATEIPDPRPRKSARVSHSGANVPSKLRYSLSSSAEEEATVADDQAEIPETPAKSKIIILKFKRPTQPIEAPPRREAKRVGRPPSKRLKRKTVDDPPTIDVATPSLPAVPPRNTCDLFCLSPSARILAFAKIALQMPESDDEEGDDVLPGSAQDWHVYTHHWCQCRKPPPLKPMRTSSEELARALMPNTVSDGTKQNPVDLTQPAASPEVELLSAPVNTILRATDAERLSKLFGPPAAETPARSGGLTSSPLTEHGFSNSQVRSSGPSRAGLQESVNTYCSPSLPESTSAKRSYEDRIREDYEALTKIRKMAEAMGVSWDFNMTYDDINNALMRSEGHSATKTSTHGLSEGVYETRDIYGQNAGFGVLYPPLQHRSNGLSSVNGVRGNSRENIKEYGTPGNLERQTEAVYGATSTERISGDGGASSSKARRQSSPPRPKSSRFRVDPRGLRGESPGPGTIINIDENKQGSRKRARRSRAAASEVPVENRN
ncbi:hypothetical protein PV08_09588 [Exophiala spinifera]|uniref:Uncharacterized protein n=1 Tax=Exophiala spinifera TaxID=91928 RepID=A0A0D1YBJ5_9EURO|nr:uncharacterized protein PV08_09588 [Exophiala spinifera]KIW12311.1 hypothetical protein PV08_09588 [Exophiala spinifera]